RILEVQPRAAVLVELRAGDTAHRHLRRRPRAVLELVVEDAVAGAHRPDARARRVPHHADARHPGVEAVRDALADARIAREHDADRRVGPDLRLLAGNEPVEAIL